MKLIYYRILFLVVISSSTIIFPINSFAVTKTWDGSDDVWDDGASWSPTGVPTNSDDIVITAGEAVILSVNGECASLDVSGSGMAIVNHNDRKLTVTGDAKVSGSGAQLRANLGIFIKRFTESSRKLIRY